MSLTLNRFHTLLVFLHCWLSMSKCSLGKCIILRSKFSIFNYNIFFFWKRSSHWWHVSVTEKMQCKVQKQPPKVFYKKGVLRNFAKFTGKQLCQSFFLNKVAGLRPATLLKKRLWYRCFPVYFAKFLRAPFLIEHLCWLLQNVFNMIQYTFELVRGLANGYLWLNSSIDIFDWSCTT